MGLLLDAYDPEVSPLLPARMRDLASAGVAEFPPRGARILRLLSRGWYRALMHRIESVTVPGIFLHYLMRKLFIEGAVRGALADAKGSSRQVVVIGAGLDTLAPRLALEGGSDARFIEVDHPLTQSVKRRALAREPFAADNFVFLELDLTKGSLETTLRTSRMFDTAVPTVFVAEGLLMYLLPEQTTAFFRSLHGLAAPGSRVVFTFMESERTDRIRFKNLPRWYAPLLDFWLRRLGEPMHWAINRAQLRDWLALTGWKLLQIADRDLFRARYLRSPALSARPLADGEYVAVGVRD